MISVNPKKSIRFKFTIGLSIFAVVLAMSASLIGYLEFWSSYEKQYEERAYTIGKMIVSNMDGNHMYRYFRGDNYTTISILRNNLQSFWESKDINSIYIALPSTGEMNYIYLRGGKEYKPNREELAYLSNMKEEYFAKRGKNALGVSIPVRNSVGDVVGIVRTEVSLTQMKSDLLQYILESIGLTLGLAGIMTIVYRTYIRSRIIDPIVSMSKEAKDFAVSHYQNIPSFPLTHKQDEIDNLGQSLTKMTNDITEYIRDIETSISEKEKMDAELRVAKTIQKSLLPQGFPRARELDMFAMMESANEVGGDFYDFFFLNDYKISCVVGDVSGKGIPAALFMTSTKEVIKNRSTDGRLPYQVFEIANNKLFESSGDKMFVTAWNGVLNLKSGLLTYVSAGHPPALIKRRNGGFEPLPTMQNKILVAFENTTYRQNYVHLQSGDIIFVYTDGVIEARNKEEELFGQDKLMEALNRISNSTNDMKSLIQELRKELVAYEKDSERKDDCTMLAFRYNGHDKRNIDHLL